MWGKTSNLIPIFCLNFFNLASYVILEAVGNKVKIPIFTYKRLQISLKKSICRVVTLWPFFA